MTADRPTWDTTRTAAWAVPDGRPPGRQSLVHRDSPNCRYPSLHPQSIGEDGGPSGTGARPGPLRERRADSRTTLDTRHAAPGTSARHQLTRRRTACVRVVLCAIPPAEVEGASSRPWARPGPGRVSGRFHYRSGATIAVRGPRRGAVV